MKRNSTVKTPAHSIAQQPSIGPLAAGYIQRRAEETGKSILEALEDTIHEVSHPTPLKLFSTAAAICDEGGRFRVPVTVSLFPFELMAICRKARHEGTTPDEIISDFVSGASGEGIMESLRDYENELPEKTEDEETANG